MAKFERKKMNSEERKKPFENIHVEKKPKITTIVLIKQLAEKYK